MDRQFLLSCRFHETFPKFLRIKLYRKALYSTSIYKSWQKKLLDNEIMTKNREISIVESSLKVTREAVQSRFGIILRGLIANHIDRIVDKFNRERTKIHENKLRDLGIGHCIQP